MENIKGSNHLITVIIRTYNNQDTILKSIKSVISQDYEDFELVIVNDGSTDKTIDNINSISDPRIKVIHQKNYGPISAAFKGIDHAKGSFITFLDGDDEFMEHALFSLWQPLNNANYGFSYCDYYEISIENEKIEYVSISNYFNIMVCGVMFKRDVIKKIGFWDRSFILPEHDYIIRVAQEYQGIHINKPLYKYHRHSASMTADKDLVKKAKQQIFEKYGHLKGFKEY